ncbi:MAG: hypothetical protein ABIT83_20560 [Massilia sp.]
MKLESIKKSTTNPQENSCVDIDCKCEDIWSMAQEFSTARLGTVDENKKTKLISDYGVRARRIAATYARFYLETEVGGDPTKIGRYYWMALGAFASKTVACTLESYRVEAMSIFTKTVTEGLGKGNFWLFCDVSGWHWYNSIYPASFEKCLTKRDSRTYVKPVQEHMKKLPWNAAALPAIENFTKTRYVEEAFSHIKCIETSSNQKRASFQLLHLIAFAKHEQEIILQPLIYDDPDL